MGDPAVSVVIVNRDGAAVLPGCLAALARQTFCDFEVILVDNGSTDGSWAEAKKWFPSAPILHQRTNTGFAQGNNIGIRASTAPFIATLNSDTLPEPDWLDALYRLAIEDRSVGMAASKILLGEKGHELDSAGMLFYGDGMTRQRGRGEEDLGQYDAGGEVLFPSACAALYRRAMLDEIGLFDEDFFSYCEDSDLGLRGRIAGWNALLAPKAVVRHLYSRTGGAYSAAKAFYVERNHCWVRIKNLPISILAGSPFYAVWRFAVLGIGLLSGRGSSARFVEGYGAWKGIKVVLRARKAAWAGMPRMFAKRRSLRKLRRLSGSELAALLRRHSISAGELMLKS